jgi:hypothetical protein
MVHCLHMFREKLYLLLHYENRLGRDFGVM